ncbi:hypothetical protein QEP16_28660 [Achromobacter insolitus]|uniref:hypothetical protein n=1 Tax=Achromobacter insolitus TaxID=217204 RepID=UPI00244EE265|nr:hypothetical protein [Achromobacter insolitus]MDH3067311.1 hypothetical protein [Achromobacter insolitus]
MRYYFSWELTERTSGMLKGEKFWNPEVAALDRQRLGDLARWFASMTLHVDQAFCVNEKQENRPPTA